MRLTSLNIVQPPRPNIKNNPMENELIIKVAMCGAFYPNYFIQSAFNNSEIIRREVNTKDPCSTIRFDGFPNKEGVLYANQLRNLLSQCSEKMDIEFEDTHAYVTFSSEENPLEFAQDQQRFCMTAQDIKEEEEKMKLRDTSVKTSVYVAVKMRQLKVPFYLIKIEPEKASKQLHNLAGFYNIKKCSGNFFSINRYRVPALSKAQKIKEMDLTFSNKKQSTYL